MSKRTIIIGDVHGCLAELLELIELLHLTQDDRVVFLGDLVDRGPDSVGVVRLVRQEGWECLMGNHEEKHIRWRRHELTRRKTGKKNPILHFDETMARHNLALTDDDVAWMASLPLSIHLGGTWRAVHAGLEPCKTYEEQKDCQSVLRTRFIEEDGTAYTPKDGDAPDPTDKWFWSQRWRGPESIVYGHHIHKFLGPQIGMYFVNRFDTDQISKPVHCVGIDTGCYAGGRLTAMILQEDGRYYFEHVDAISVHYPLSEKYGPTRPKPLYRAVSNDSLLKRGDVK